MARNDSAGFTLVEIAVAVAVLGLALTTLIGLQTRMLDTYYNEHKRIEASLYGQYVFSLIEVSGDTPEPGAKSGPLENLLDEYGFFEKDPPAFKRNLKGWQYELVVESLDIQQLRDVLRKLTLTISWGETEDESFSLSYFVSNFDAAQLSGTLAGGGLAGTP